MKVKGIYSSLTAGLCLNFIQNSMVKGIRPKEEYESSAGYSSEFTDGQVALIVIALMVAIPLAGVGALYLYDKLRKKAISPGETEDVTKRENVTDTNIFGRRPLPAIKTKKPAHSPRKDPEKEIKSITNPVNQSQRPLGTVFHMRQGEVRPLPPIATSIFTIQRPPTPPTYESLYPGSAPY